MVDHYNLQVILAGGYRVRSLRGTQFRQWATERRSESNPCPKYINQGSTKEEVEKP